MTGCRTQVARCTRLSVEEPTEEPRERVHAHLDIDERALQEMMSLLAETLEDFDFEDRDIAIVADEIKSRGRFIVTRR